MGRGRPLASVEVIPYPASPLADGRVLLRPWTETDLGLVEEAARDVHLLAGTTLSGEYTHAEGLAFIERQRSRQQTGEGISLCVTADGEPVGCATLMYRRQRVAALGYWLVRTARGKGVGTLAVKLLSEW